MQSVDRTRIVRAPGHQAYDLVSIGETMVAFVSRGDSGQYLAVPAGAESNLAIGMVQLGCRTQWVSRLGDDPLGDFVESSIAGRGVAVDVVRDAHRPTGVMTIHVRDGERHATYYRSGSAARELGPEDLERVSPARWMHVTGITPALSESARALVEAAVGRTRHGGGHVSFDVNYRPALWAGANAAVDTLLPLARAADLVFVGDDEANALFGTSSPEDLRALMLQRPDQHLVVKRGAGPASVVTEQAVVTEPGIRAEVVEVTGAGDAFAAGYLAATVFGWPVRGRLRLGHLMGARTIGVLDHVPPPFTATELERITPAALEAQWAEGRHIPTS